MIVPAIAARGRFLLAMVYSAYDIINIHNLAQFKMCLSIAQNKVIYTNEIALNSLSRLTRMDGNLVTEA